ncbi:MAG: TIGR00730 family Rossman fold protein [bacterium]|nr:TIGR00730 family Rossman fold protein [bacterium]
MKRICVFCGSHFGNDPAYRAAAAELGEGMVERGLGLVYGGGAVGMMGVVADAVMAGGGEVIGVIPRSLRDREVAHHGLTELQVVDSMHERKRLMYARAEAVVALPGGIGTLDELFESMTWNQLGIHLKPAGLLNVGGYFDPLIAMLDRAFERGFVGRAYTDFLLVESTVDSLLDALEGYRPPSGDVWVRPSDVPTDATE